MAGPAKPGRKCRTCEHRLRPEIDRSLVRRTASLAGLSRTYGISIDALSAHRDRHLSEEQKRAIIAEVSRETAAEVDERINADILDIRGGVARVVSEIELILNRAKARGDDPLALTALRDMRLALLDLGKVYGQLKDVTTINVEIASTPQWELLRAILVETFEAHPEALPTFISKARPLNLPAPVA